MGLVLTRRVDESIDIDTASGKITITVCEAAHGKCRLGIQAPPTCAISRDNMKKGSPNVVPIPKNP